jgi:hypothetical protein
MKQKMIIAVALMVLFGAFFLAIPAVEAQLLDQPNQYDSRFARSIFGGDTVPVIISNIISFLLLIAGGIAIIFIIFAGFRYITAGGNESAAESAKKTLTNAIIGFIVILLAYLILKVVENLILQGVGGGGGLWI